MGVAPQDILPDAIDATEIDGVIVRKGTIAAAMANANIIASIDASIAEKQQALNAFITLSPGLVALKVHQHLTWNNPDLQKIIEDLCAQKAIC